LHVGWLRIIGVVSFGVWFNEFLRFFFLEISGDLSGGVGGLLSFSIGFLFSVNLGISLNVGAVLLVLGTGVVRVLGPVGFVFGIDGSLGGSDGWLFSIGFLFGLLLHVDLRFSLNKVAVLESALDEMEKVSYELGFLLFIDFFEKLGVHLFLKELVHVNLEVSLKESLLSKSNLVHVVVHAHFFDLSHHLSLGLKFSGLGR